MMNYKFLTVLIAFLVALQIILISKLLNSTKIKANIGKIKTK